MGGLAGRLAVHRDFVGGGVVSVLGSAVRDPGGPGVRGGGSPVSRACLGKRWTPGAWARETIGHARGLGG